MADNALWALEHLGPGGRLLVFAHNAHVVNEPQRGDICAGWPSPRAAWAGG